MSALASSLALSPDWTLRACIQGSSAQRVLIPGDVLTGAAELDTVEFQAGSEGDWALEIDDERLEPSQPGSWAWRPGFFAGEVTARLLDLHSGRSAEYRIDVAPDASKLGRDLFESMLQQVWLEAPELLIGAEPARREAGAEATSEDLLLQYGRLRRWGPAFVRAMAAVRRQPIQRLRRERRRVPLHLIRRSDRRTVTDLVRHGAIQVGGADAPSTLDPAALFDTPADAPTLDNPANRTMLALVYGLLKRVRTVARRLGRRVETEADSETRTSLAQRWPARRRFLRDLELSIRRIRLEPPFAELPRGEVSPPASPRSRPTPPTPAHIEPAGSACVRGSPANRRSMTCGCPPPGKSTSAGAGSSYAVDSKPRATWKATSKASYLVATRPGEAYGTMARRARCSSNRHFSPLRARATRAPGRSAANFARTSCACSRRAATPASKYSTRSTEPRERASSTA